MHDPLSPKDTALYHTTTFFSVTSLEWMTQGKKFWRGKKIVHRPKHGNHNSSHHCVTETNMLPQKQMLKFSDAPVLFDFFCFVGLLACSPKALLPTQVWHLFVSLLSFQFQIYIKLQLANPLLASNKLTTGLQVFNKKS